ncbi:MAG TPA: YdcF family protein [Stellaceae bacterium]|nr:YdcF family protein [Stellaceae bacterium]
MPRPPRLSGRTLTLALLVFGLWLGGFTLFVVSSLLIRDDTAIATDAIVVLTGGRQRLETGIDLLGEGKAQKLFVSGVNQRVDREELLHALGPAAERASCCIELGHEADNTLGNAHETAGWMRAEGYRSLRLVTSWYHMRRSLLEFGRAMPRITIVAHPVFGAHLEAERWWGWHGAPLLVFAEYHKYLASWARPLLGALLPPASPAPATRTTDAQGGSTTRIR